MLDNDNEGMVATWNTSASLRAKLISAQDETPVSGQVLSLYVNETDTTTGWKWIWICNNTTGDDGIASFSFFVDMLDGVYNYSVIYEGQNPYLPALNGSYFVVIGDPAGYITLSVSNVRCRVDTGISLDCSAGVHMPDDYWDAVVFHSADNPSIGSISVDVHLYLNSIDVGSYSTSIITYLPGIHGYNGGGHISITSIGGYSFPALLWGRPWDSSIDYFTIHVSVSGSYDDTAIFPLFPIPFTIKNVTRSSL